MPAAIPGNKGAASLAYFYFGDSFFRTLAQESGVNLNLCKEGYNKTIILKEDNNNGIKITLNGQGNDSPTKTNFLKYLKQLADEGYYVDLFLFAHGTNNEVVMKGGDLTSSEISTQLSQAGSGYQKFPIRIVYQMNCYGQTLNQTWRNIGAKATGGARYVNFYPNQFNEFGREWNKGTVKFNDAFTKANTASARTVFQTTILADALATRSKWGGCPFSKTVLGSDSCAKDYFTKMWIGNSEWQANMSGKENMNYSSTKVRLGETGLTKRSSVSWS
jgi:hypothetical protein